TPIQRIHRALSPARDDGTRDRATHSELKGQERGRDAPEAGIEGGQREPHAPELPDVVLVFDPALLRCAVGSVTEIANVADAYDVAVRAHDGKARLQRDPAAIVGRITPEHITGDGADGEEQRAGKRT